MSNITYVSPFIPPEWIAAHGLTPCRLLPRRDHDSVLSTEAGVCTFASAFANDTADHAASGTIFTTTCDAMRRAAELAEAASAPRNGGAEPLFLFNVPATWQTVAAQRLYLSELRRLGRWLIRHGGRAPGPERLAATMRQWDDARSAARAARPLLRARAFAEALIEMHRTGSFPGRAEAVLDTAGLPVALVGGPLLSDDLWLYDAIESAGTRIAFDATETGERGLPPPFDRRQMRDDPLLLLADTYFGQLPDAFRRPNTRLYEYLTAGFHERGVRAVVLVRRVACDLWRAEAARIREWCEWPCVNVDLTGEGDVRARTQSALQTLCETIA